VIKLKFTKGEDGAIAVKIKDEGVEKDFSYVEMIQYLYTKKDLEEPEFTDDINENEQTKLKDMIGK
jgi:hypothetical protein